MDSIAIFGFILSFLGVGIVAISGTLIVWRNEKDLASVMRGYIGLLFVAVGLLFIQTSRLLESGESINIISGFNYLGPGICTLAGMIGIMGFIIALYGTQQENHQVTNGNTERIKSC